MAAGSRGSATRLVAVPETRDEDTAQVPRRRVDRGRRPTGSSPTRPVVLSCQQVEVSYGPVQILFGVDLEVHEGEIVALLGTNGAGKSTLLKGASGLVKVGGGAVWLDGARHRRATRPRRSPGGACP